jgi:predicted lipid-binding transport protein (Tim44 family)
VKDADGNVVEGDTKAIISVEDVMGFERNTRSSNPNWTIVSL